MSKLPPFNPGKLGRLREERRTLLAVGLVARGDQLKSLAFLNERRKMMTRASFEALYQQSPIVVGGGMFPIEMFKPIQRLNRSLIKKSVRYIDKAATEDGGAYTACVLMHEMKDDVVLVDA
jgi:hypothetical protein